jgi:hypothetical protein
MAPHRCQRRIVAGLTGKISAHRRRFTSRDNAASQSGVGVIPPQPTSGLAAQRLILVTPHSTS